MQTLGPLMLSLVDQGPEIQIYIGLNWFPGKLN
jgi:hypothetical protein